MPYRSGTGGLHNVLRAGRQTGTILRMVTGDAEAAFEIRRALPDDWRALRRIRLAALTEAPYAFGSTLGGAIDRPEQHWRARITASPQFIAWMGTEPVGLAAALAEPPEHGGPAGDYAGPERGAGASGNWQLVSMWVSPRARGRGIADRLVAAVGDCARADGAECLTLWVADASARARAFYRRTGFRSTGRRQLVRPEEPDHWEEEQALDLSRPTAP
jgi:ribosomal protein S18 acetylase RimI-like enzyme